MRAFLSLFIISLSTCAFACSCEPPVNSKDVAELMEYTDVAVVGTFLSDIITESTEQGTNILFLVDKVLKGQVLTDTISILQINEGDCQHLFEKGKQYVVFGLTVTGIECKNSASKKEYEQTPPPPPADELDNGTIVRAQCTDEHRIEYWNNLIAQRPSFLTNTCVTYLGNSKPGQLILNN